MSTDIIVAIFGVLGTVIMAVIGLYVALSERRNPLVSDALAMLERHDEEIKELKEELRWYRLGVAILIRQLREAGIEPEWTPDMPRDKEK